MKCPLCDSPMNSSGCPFHTDSEVMRFYVDTLREATQLLKKARCIDAPNDTDNRLMASMPLLPDDICSEIDAFTARVSQAIAND